MMRVVMIALGAALLAAPALAEDNDAVMAPVHQFIDGFNKGDVESALAACASEASIIDEFAPYAWNGEKACAIWANDYAADAEARGVTDGAVTLGEAKHVMVEGDAAYLVVPADYAYKENGKKTVEKGATMTVALKMIDGAWKITQWSWAKS